MADVKFDWSPVEPAHPAVVKLHDDLVGIYTHLREKYQKEIDDAFDRVSRQIGFVVTTAVPVVLEVNKEGVVKSVNMGADHLKGTLFERELSTVLGKLDDPIPIPKVAAGTYRLYLLWFDAIKLRLRTDWMEPAHFLKERLVAGIRPELAARVRPEVREPAHWFDPGIAIAVEEAVLIEALDEVYPELRLVERIAASRAALRRQLRPEVKEPAHFRQLEQGLQSEKAQEMLAELVAVLRRYGY